MAKQRRMTRQREEEWLVERARRGDLEAFNTLVERHQSLIYNLCARMLADRDIAADVTQEAFLLAFRGIDRFRGENLRAWLLRIAANACFDELRRRARRPATSLDAAGGLPTVSMTTAPAATEPETAALRAELRREIERVLALLPPDQRLAVILCDVQGLRYAEIADVMRASIGTVKSRVSRGRAKLRALLRAGGEPLPSIERQEIVEKQAKQRDEA
jgi:RNA polymerase sigma factor (sigma-70 family)